MKQVAGSDFLQEVPHAFIANKAESCDPSQLLIRQLFHCSKQSPLNPPCWQVSPPGCRPCPTPSDLWGSCGAAGLPLGRTVSGGQSEWECVEKRGEREEEIKRRECQRPDQTRNTAPANTDYNAALLAFILIVICHIKQLLVAHFELTCPHTR